MSEEPEMKLADPDYAERVSYDSAFIVEMLTGFKPRYAMDVFIFAATDMALNLKPLPPLTRLEVWDKYAAVIRENIRLNIEQEMTNGNAKQPE